MVFSSSIFIFIFLPVTVVLYFLPIGKLFKDKGRWYKNIVLLVASLVFYGWGEPYFIFIMLASIALNWLIGLGLGKYDSTAIRRLLLAATLVLNLGLLFVFKYLGFVSGIFGDSTVNIALPLGISFYTFQILSYTLDVFFNKNKVQKNILLLGLYISMFPQLVAGPIVRYDDVSKELLDRQETSADITEGVTRFVYGMGKKVIIANFLAIITDNIFPAAGTLSVATAWLGIISYTLQIYFDFSGYSDMAIGMGRIFGFHFPENFNYPYASLSFTEYWRRWHMTLGSWMRDYLFYPLQKSNGFVKLGAASKKALGKKRGKYVTQILSLFALWLAMGVWHGADWTFIIWGLMYFVLMSFESLSGFGKKALKLADTKGSALKKIPYRIYLIFFLLIAYVFFRADSLPLAFSYIGNMFAAGRAGAAAFADDAFLRYIDSVKILLPAAIILCTPFAKWVSGKCRDGAVKTIVRGVLTLAIFALCIILTVSGSYNPFIYFNF